MIKKEADLYVYTGSGIPISPLMSCLEGPEKRVAGVRDNLEKPKPMD
jgi:hypothetical protein